MNKIESLKRTIEEGRFPKEYPEFGGANLIITKDKNRNYHDGDIVVYSNHAGALSWLATQLRDIYMDNLNHIERHIFYPTIGKVINDTFTKEGLIFESMLEVVERIEKEWGPR